MDEPAAAEVQADVGNLALDVEEENISNLKIAARDWLHLPPEISGRTWHWLAGCRVRVLHQSAAVESADAAAAVTVGYANLAYGDDRCLFAGMAPAYS
jgi:hypothetical protein